MLLGLIGLRFISLPHCHAKNCVAIVNMAFCKINAHNYLGHLDCLVESVLKTPVKNNLSPLLTNVAILAEEVINPRRLCLGINIWNKDSLVLSPLNAA